jgi:hypothetical protein
LAITAIQLEEKTMAIKLPPDPEGMNEDRAEWAAAALRHFQCTTGTEYDYALGDLLCDLMHWADRNDFDFEAALFRAQRSYAEETEPETPEESTCSGSSIQTGARK